MKFSWSVLNAWSRGNRDDAIKMMAGLEIPKNPAMIRGNKLHKIVSDNKLKLIPEISDSAIFEDIVPEQKKWVNYFRTKINDWCELSMVIDVLDKKNNLIVDWKASSLRSSEHSKMQIYLYALGMNKEGIKIDKGIFATINDVDEAVICDDYSIFKINDEKLELAENYVDTIGGEIYEFLQSKKK